MQSLPIVEKLSELRSRLRENAVVILQAPPGAGKTTMVPPALLDEPWLAGKRIVVLEPRRLAARAAAARMAENLREPLGETVGYRIRFESKVSARTRIEVVTEGILTRQLQSDAALENVGLVIFDEFHERHLQTDLGLALALDSQRVLRPDLRILIMSATLDGVGIAKQLNAPLIASDGRLFPVALRYVAPATDASIVDRVVPVVRQALTAETGDVLVFLPGAGEIRRTQERLADLGAGTDVYPLYGDLSWEQQDRALRPSANRKVILATPIAETSLTIDGVRVVVDAGYTRVPQFDPATGLTRLVTSRVARSSADQRAGRAGRLGPGACYRLWTESTHHGLLAQPLAEIKTADLSGLALELALWGVKDVASLTWIDPPPPAALSQARDLLRELGALDSRGDITALGRDMARLPLHPRLAHLVLVAAARGALALGCDVAAIVSERDIFSAGARYTVDLTERLDALAAFRERGRDGARRFGADAAACARVDQAARQWRRLVRDAKCGDQATTDPGLLLAAAYPDRVAAQRRANRTSYLLANGRGVRLPDYEERLRPSYLVAANVDAGSGEGVIHLATAIDVETVREAAGESVEVRDVVRWDESSSAVIARREERLGQLLLSTSSTTEVAAEAITTAMLHGIRAMGIESLPWTDAARSWQARVLSLRAWCPEQDWPDVSDTALRETLESWLAPYLDGYSRREHLARLDLLSILHGQLNRDQVRKLEEGAPAQLTVPSGSRVRLDYRPGEPPVLAVKLQEMFGATDTPRVAFGRVPVMLHLLSPARRPVQVTQDLSGFWSRTYTEVRKELKGRYPKHPWPDDPLQAPPTARAVKRGRR